MACIPLRILEANRRTPRNLPKALSSDGSRGFVLALIVLAISMKPCLRRRR